MTSGEWKARNLARVVDGRAEALIALTQGHLDEIARAAAIDDGVARGYAPPGYGLADFSVIRHGGMFHLFHIPRVPGNHCLHPVNEH